MAPELARFLRRRRETTREQTMTTTNNTKQSNVIHWRKEKDGDSGGDGDRNGKWGKVEEEHTTIEG